MSDLTKQDIEDWRGYLLADHTSGGSSENDKLNIADIHTLCNLAIEALELGAEWVRVSERMPDAGDYSVECHSRANVRQILGVTEFRTQIHFAKGTSMWTHWKPLAAAPKED